MVEKPPFMFRVGHGFGLSDKEENACVHRIVTDLSPKKTPVTAV